MSNRAKGAEVRGAVAAAEDEEEGVSRGKT